MGKLEEAVLHMTKILYAKMDEAFGECIDRLAAVMKENTASKENTNSQSKKLTLRKDAIDFKSSLGNSTIHHSQINLNSIKSNSNKVNAIARVAPERVNTDMKIIQQDGESD